MPPTSFRQIAGHIRQLAGTNNREQHLEWADALDALADNARIVTVEQLSEWAQLDESKDQSVSAAIEKIIGDKP